MDKGGLGNGEESFQLRTVLAIMLPRSHSSAICRPTAPNAASTNPRAMLPEDALAEEAA